MIEIEDFCEDIIGKAMRGLSVSTEELSKTSGVTSNWINNVLAGQFNEPVIRAIAPHLNLDQDSLVISGQKTWRPKPVELPGLAIFNTQWHEMRVNAYLVWDLTSGHAAAFDTGATTEKMIEEVCSKDLTLDSIYLTHTHRDHIADLNNLKNTFDSLRIYVNSKEPIDEAELIECGHKSAIGSLSVQTRLTCGHSKGGQTYVISGLDRPVAIVGDALFAGSMGGGMVSYSDALKTNRQQIFTLPDDTVVCPGHGPMSSIGEEKQHNPFYPEFKTNNH